MNVRISAGLSMLALAVSVTVGWCQVPVVRTGIPVSHNLPPAMMLLEPGPGVGGPGPGVLTPAAYSGAVCGVGTDCGIGCATGCPGYGSFTVAGQMGGGSGQTAQVLFDKPESMQVQWDISAVGMYDSTPLVVPGRQNFGMGGVYRLKLTNIEGRPGLELYPTLEIGPTSNRTAAYLAHAAIPIQLTQEDFDQVTSGNFVTKVIYVPDPEYQELALAGVETLVSTRLDPGVDPIVEADRRGAILAIVRMGNKDLEMPGEFGIGGGMVGGGIVGGGMAGGGTIGHISGYIAGVTGPNYGMPHTGTNIGLPGPPHIPLGGPAGLQQYNMYNHTAMSIPGPTPNVNVHMQQVPGLSYPRPADTVLIREHTIRNPYQTGQPPADMVHGNIPYHCDRCGLTGLNCRCR